MLDRFGHAHHDEPGSAAAALSQTLNTITAQISLIVVHLPQVDDDIEDLKEEIEKSGNSLIQRVRELESAHIILIKDIEKRVNDLERQVSRWQGQINLLTTSFVSGFIIILIKWILEKH